MSTPLRRFHDRRLAILTTYRDVEVPIQYQGCLGEHSWTRTNASLFDFGFALVPAHVRESSKTELTTIAIHGPLSENALADLDLTVSLTHPQQTPWGTIWLSPNSDLGEVGFELHIPAATVDTFCEKLCSNDSVHPAGLAAYNSLRIEAGLPLQGYEFSNTDDSELVPTIEHSQTRLVGLVSQDEKPLREKSELVDEDGTFMGVITSATYGPTIGSHIGLGYVSVDREHGETLKTVGNSGEVNIRLTKLPLLI